MWLVIIVVAAAIGFQGLGAAGGGEGREGVGRPRKASEPLTSIAECTGAMAGLLIATTLLEELVAKRDREVAEVQVKYEGRVDDAKTRKADYETGLEQYYYEHVTEIEKDGVKHVDLSNG